MERQQEGEERKMDKKFLESIGVHTEDGLAAILEQLEEKQLEYFERLENVNDSKREEELKQILSKPPCPHTWHHHK